MQKTVSYGPGSTTTLRMRGVQREDRQFISTDPPGVGPQLHALPYAASICMNFDSGLVMAAMGTSANNDLEVMCTAETLRAILFGRLLCWPVKSQEHHRPHHQVRSQGRFGPGARPLPGAE